jgi:hypothetical protein
MRHTHSFRDVNEKYTMGPQEAEQQHLLQKVGASLLGNVLGIAVKCEQSKQPLLDVTCKAEAG